MPNRTILELSNQTWIRHSPLDIPLKRSKSKSPHSPYLYSTLISHNVLATGRMDGWAGSQNACYEDVFGLDDDSYEEALESEGDNNVEDVRWTLGECKFSIPLEVADLHLSWESCASQRCDNENEGKEGEEGGGGGYFSTSHKKNIPYPSTQTHCCVVPPTSTSNSIMMDQWCWSTQRGCGDSWRSILPRLG